MKKILKKVNETGTLLVEAMAMLGLIAMVTPVLYKKASERTVELQDVNASAQMRALSTAIDSYLKDNFARITKGEKITNSAGNEVDYADFKNANDGQVGPVSITHFGDYLPYGFLNADGTPRETKLFDDDYNVVIKLESDVKDGKVLSQTLTGFVTATPKIPDEIGQVRASRIASMIGSNGGYVITEEGKQVAMGAQGIWSVPTSEFSDLTLADNSFVVSSVQPISSQGLANEDVLHRKNEPDADDELNTMETDLFMGYTIGDTRNIRFVNQIIMHPDVSRMVGGDDGDNSERTGDTPTDTLDPAGFGNTLDKALYIAKGGGAYVEGALQAINSRFTVKEGGTEDGIRYYGTTGGTTDPVTGTTTPVTRATDPTLQIDGEKLVYGDPGAGKAKLTVKSAGSMSFGTSEVPANGGTPAQAGVESLYADKTNFRAGDGNLNVIKDGADWYTVIKKDAAGNATAHEGGRSTYTWNGAVPTEDATEKTGKYEVSINGSAFVKDTMLTGKLKSFNVDAATLRAGVDPNEFDAAKDDTDFYIVAKKDEVNGGQFIVGTNDIPFMTISDSEILHPNGDIKIPGGVSINTADASNGAKGIDISAGSAFLVHYDENRRKYIVSEGTQDSIVRIGGEKGVNISTVDEDGDMTNAPVSIQKETLRVFKDENFGWKTVDMFSDQVRIMSDWMWRQYQSNPNYFANGKFDYIRYGYRPTSYGRFYLADTSFVLSSYTGQPILDVVSSASASSPTARLVGSFALYDSGFNMNTSSDYGNNDTYNNQDGYAGYGAAATIYANRGIFQIRDYNKTYAADDPEYGTNSYRSNKVKVFTVSSTGANTSLFSDSDRLSKNGSVYIRRGSMALESNVDETNNRKLTNSMINTQYNNANDAVGYIAADRFISHYKPSNILGESDYGGTAGGGNKNYKAYDGYEINPAYTSVMHDIKLTTRGGARLSDILPDFINKGIYVVDTTYSPDVAWVPNTTAIPTSEVGDSANNEVSPYAGFVPTPKCPPGYAKSITLTPAGWNMAEAGTPWETADGNLDIRPHYNIDAWDDIDPVTNLPVDREPLLYQKSTWLKAMILPYCGKFQEDNTGCTRENFKGWGAIMGFIYPAAYWGDALGVLDTSDKQSDVYWNLFPVYYRQIEGYATVYCYFDRSSFDTYDEVYHDYDQLKAHEAGNINSWKKDGDNANNYINRLNDPKLKYYDPW